MTAYTERLKAGEEEMSRLHQTMKELTKKHSSILLSKENEMLEVRTYYAKQLSQLINECVGRNECQVCPKSCFLLQYGAYLSPWY